LGLLISTIGYDLVTGEIRYTFGTLYLQDGVPFVQALIGLFAISQAIRLSISGRAISSEARFEGRLVEGSLRVLKHPGTLIRSSIIGTVIGALPGAGIVTASFVSYGEAVRGSRTPENFGKGEPEGVIAAEAANNAAILAELIPTITLGIPGGAGVAVFLGAMIMHGITPGPMAFTEGGEAISGLYIGLFLSTFLILVTGLTIAPYFARATLTPNYSIVPTILVLSIFGSYALRNSIEDVLLTVGFGILGFVMSQYGFSLIPLILGMVLGPIAEQGFQRALIISQGDFSVFFASSTARTMWVLLLVAVTAPLYGPWIARLRRRAV
jgi:putative tricarboxylic transport membrane protein